jgi:hypothetical protein
MKTHRIHLLYISIILLLIMLSGCHRPIAFEYEKAPVDSGFKMDGYWIWGGSMIRVGDTYHLFASRWKKGRPFPRDYRQNSEIVRATSKTPEGPFKFREVVIGERDSAYWDSNMAHNPTIHKIGDEYVLFYFGSDFTTHLGDTEYLLRRVGYATAKSIAGPWKRSDQPLIDVESNNPAVLAEDGRVILVYRNEKLRVFAAEADTYKGPFKVMNEDLWPECRIEDYYLLKANGKYHLICEDNAGCISGHERWGVHLYSDDGTHNWKKYDPVVAYDHDIIFRDNTVLHCVRRERPQLLIVNGRITHLLTGVYDGHNSWCQVVRLKKPVKVEK